MRVPGFTPHLDIALSGKMPGTGWSHKAGTEDHSCKKRCQAS
jgi:hypothetical protein